VWLQSRARRLNAASTGTLAAYSVEGGPGFFLDDTLLAETGNDVTVSGPGISSQRHISATGVTEAGRYDVDVATLLRSEGQAYARAKWQALMWGTSGPTQAGARRASADLRALDAAGGAWLAAIKVSDQLTLDGLPATAPAAALSLVVEGVEHRVTARSHVVSLDTSPALGETPATWGSGEWDDGTWAL
jgi:hypothetical protein